MERTRAWCVQIVGKVSEELLKSCVSGADELSDVLEDACDAAEAGDFRAAARLLRGSWNQVPWSVQHDLGLKLAPLVVTASVLCATVADPVESPSSGRFAVEVAAQLQARGVADTATALVATMTPASTMAEVEEMLLCSDQISAESLSA